MKVIIDGGMAGGTSCFRSKAAEPSPPDRWLPNDESGGLHLHLRSLAGYW